ncbi:MAG: ABC transporter ATP-binding protein [Candidatus Krumholzibacteria bacterium]|jgi:ATP-binding cassette subfamily B protein|nr:ABC transporter ATP-binding protein [Candidatus Krumholzibacteria bacterium]MDP6669598.1 ABC transporter ATP-binding protein [Candidatus Krumholzibacteria bacterium]MDP6798150.1 ABC transporter ATP-binding protein [Candidatus Krumholzibacteria bacterium]MDP7022003.1 ABC transporter ATP-binding protein [Candidatus Krumholzibacteria bacterium]
MWWHDSHGLDDKELQGRLPTWDMLRRVAPYVREHRLAFGVSFLLSLVAVAMTLGQPLLFKHIIDVDVPSGDLSSLFRTALAYLGLMIGSGLATMSATVLLGHAGVEAVNGIKRDLFRRFLDLGLLWLTKLPTGTLVSRIESDSQRLVALTSTMMMRILSALGVLLGAMTVLASVDLRLFLVAVMVVPVMVGGTLFLFRWMRPRFRKERSLYAKLTGVIAEMVPSARFLQAAGQVGWAEEKIRRENLGYNRFIIRLGYIEYGFFHGLGFLEVVMTVIALWMGSRWIGEGTITVGALVLFAQYIAQIYWPIIALSEQLAEIQRAGGAADRIFAALERSPDVPSPRDPVPVPRDAGEIRFEKVDFSYEEDTPVLRDISFQLKAGETLALVGPTGGGKSSVVNLACRFMDPDRGRVLLDGQDLRHFDPIELRRLFGMVFQDLFLFPVSVTENLRAFREDIPRERVVEAAQTAGLDDLISGLEKGYDTVMVGRGEELSYGQRQLMAFARALAVDPKILVLDEATSSVDPGTERKIQKTLETLTEGRTTLVVAHRLSTIRRANRILVIEDGRICESGRHEELMEAGGHYADLVRLQTGEDPQ